MNRYPWWKYAILLVALLLGALYTAPNFFGEAPAVQVSAGKSTVKVDETTLERVRSTLAGASIPVELLAIEGSSVRARFGDTDTQIKAKDAIARALNPDPADERFIVALNLVSRTPQWMARLRALPMYLGLDLRGGVHFLMEVDMRAALRQQIDGYASDARNALREKRIRFSGITREAEGLTVGLPEPATADTARDLLAERMPAIQWAVQATPEGTRLVGRLQPQAVALHGEEAIRGHGHTLISRTQLAPRGLSSRAGLPLPTCTAAAVGMRPSVVGRGGWLLLGLLLRCLLLLPVAAVWLFHYRCPLFVCGWSSSLPNSLHASGRGSGRR
jgi:preprotein translocase subunit SecD